MAIRVFFIFIFIFSCSEKKNSEAEFSIPNGKFAMVASEDSGIDFSNDLSSDGDFNIIEYLYYYNGGGVAIGDINNDGLDDIYLTANEASDRLYLNQGNLKFKDITETAGILMDASWSTGVTMADVNNDGKLDIYVCKLGDYKGHKAKNQLYINQGNNIFLEKAKDVGLDFSGFSTQASFLDYDKDGDLDMYLLNHSVHTPRAYGTSKLRTTSDSLSGDIFFENKLSDGRLQFNDVTKAVGIYNSPLGYGLAIATSDVNNDGFVDIYVGNDFHENDYLYINNGDKSFTESSRSYFNHTSRFTMGVDIADLNNDNKLDVVTLDMMPSDADIFLKSAGEDSDKVNQIKNAFGFEQQYARNHLQINIGNHFNDVALLTKTHATDWSWSPLIFDFDNNGFNDLFITNGIYKRPNDLDYVNYLSNFDFTQISETKQDSIEVKLIESMPMINLPNVLYANNGGLKFESVPVDDSNTASYSNGAAFSDLDLDGDIDVVINNINQKVTLLENLATESAENNFISVKLKDTTETSTLHSKIYVYSGTEKFFKELTTTKGFMSSSTEMVHFGLGNRTGIDSIVVLWPDNAKSILTEATINSTIEIKKRDTNPFNYSFTSVEVPITFGYSHIENPYLDYEREPLIPENLSLEGPSAVQADFNADGLLDIFIGGATNQPPKLFVQTKSEAYVEKPIEAFLKDAYYEDVDAEVFDIDNDGDLDIYALTGGNEYNEGNPNLEDRVYLNDGLANFSKLESNLLKTNGGSVSSADFDGDGLQDLFVGNRSMPGGYGLAPFSYILRNRGDNSFDVVSRQRYGMITDSQWADLNKDGNIELVLAGDWMPITILSYNPKIKKFEDKTQEYGLDRTHGLWNTIEVADLNNDGNFDILGGNAGLNIKWKASVENPVTMYLDDLDKNGQLDQFIFYDLNGETIPFASKDKLVQQVPLLKKEFVSYETFSKVRSFEELTNKDPRDIIEIKYIYELRSMAFISNGNTFKTEPLPLEAQLSSIEDFYIEESRILATGNYYGYVTELGESSSNPGFSMSSYIDKNPQPLNLPKEFSGRKILKLNKNKFLILGNNSNAYSINVNIDDTE